MIRIFGLVIWTVKDVEELYRQVDKATSDAKEAKYDVQRYMMYCRMMFLFIMRNLPLKRKRKALRRMLAEAEKGKEGGRR